MSKGTGRLLAKGENTADGVGTHSFSVRVPDGYRPTYVAVSPIEGQTAGTVRPLGHVYTTDTLPAVTDGAYYNAVIIYYENTTSGARGVFYQVFYEPVDGSDLANAESI